MTALNPALLSDVSAVHREAGRSDQVDRLVGMGLIAHGEHISHRCPSWTADLIRQRGRAPEVA